MEKAWPFFVSGLRFLRWSSGWRINRISAPVALLVFVCVFGDPNAAHGSESFNLGGESFKFDWNSQIYGYGALYGLQRNSVLNPDNSVAQLPNSVLNAEARFKLDLKAGSLKLHLMPILSLQAFDPQLEQKNGNHIYISQGMLRYAPSQTTLLSAGRELLTWGPSQFRSPSNPFYFYSGRNDPNRQLSGVDVARMIWAPNQAFSLWAGWVADTSHVTPNPDPWTNTWIMKLDFREYDWSAGLALAKANDHDLFVGLDAQWTLSDAWLLYAEMGSGNRSNALVSPSDPTQPFRLEKQSSRHTSMLLGAALTLENGQTLNLEYLYYGPGYTRSQESAYFDRATSATLSPPPLNYQILGTAISQAPPLLGQNYLYLVWQNNVLSNGPYWRLMVATNLVDTSCQFAAYAEYPLSKRTVVYGLGVVNTGGPRREMDALLSSALTLGVRMALP